MTGALLGVAALTLARTASLREVLTFTGASASGQVSHSFPSQQELPSIVRRVSPYYSNEDRERLAKQRQERRLALKERAGSKQSHKPLIDMDKLPAIEEIYTRAYTGDADIDPIGGRKRYTYWVLFKHADTTNTPGKLKPIILEYMLWLKKKMSCRNIKVFPRKSPIDGNSIVQLEYEMKEYGEIPREQKLKNKYSRATLVEFQFQAPADAQELIGRRFYSDINVLRFMVMCHTRNFKHAGEDNELLL
eukprot:TRINITY_DN93482_c0_g1_i1.p1 TRINITY_DN93482_c0_g1~~TRINITY_DN93482_c0_g1_i1.p1  ORF type:complete len:291 (+),score=66.88 TRINITY_DN93482_c0_g1_i1:130-873(+)